MLAGDNDTTGAVDLAIDPSNPNRVFAAMWDHLREPDLRTYGGVGSGVYRSTNGGTDMATTNERTSRLRQHDRPHRSRSGRVESAAALRHR